MNAFRIVVIAVTVLAACRRAEPPNEEVLRAEARKIDAENATQQAENELEKANQAKLGMRETLGMAEAELQAMGIERPAAGALSNDIESGIASRSQRESLLVMLADFARAASGAGAACRHG